MCWSSIQIRQETEAAFQNYLKRDSILALDNAFSYGHADRFLSMTWFSGEDATLQRAVLRKYLLTTYALRSGLRGMNVSQELRSLAYESTFMKLFSRQVLSEPDSTRTIVSDVIPGYEIQLISINERWLWDFSASFPGHLLSEKLAEFENKTALFNEMAHAIEKGDSFDPRTFFPR